MNEIKAIPTRYKGYHFRSRLEARWAVFFDTLGIKWEYEKEGYKDEDTGVCYLPDFYLPESKTFIEVKGDFSLIKNNREFYNSIIDFGGILPYCADSENTNHGLLLLGNIPDADINIASVILHPILQHHKGVCMRYGFFTNRAFMVIPDNDPVCGNFITLFVDDEIFGIDGLDAGDIYDWDFEETIIIKTKRYYKNVAKAYNAARSARFEHGESGET